MVLFTKREIKRISFSLFFIDIFSNKFDANSNYSKLKFFHSKIHLIILGHNKLILSEMNLIVSGIKV